MPKSVNCKNISNAEDVSILNYAAAKSQTIVLPTTRTHFWNDYNQFSGSERLVGTLAARFRRCHAPRMHHYEQFDVETRVRMLFSTLAPVGPEFLKILEERADVQLDPLGHIVKYTEHAPNGLILDCSALKMDMRGQSKRRKTTENEEGTEEDNSIFSTLFEQKPPLELLNFGEFQPGTSCEFLQNSQNLSEILAPKDADKSNEIEMETMREEMGEMREIIKQLVQKQSSSPTSAPPTGSAPTSISKKGFLHSLRALILLMDDPEMAGARLRVNEAIRKMENTDESIPIEKARKFVELGVEMFSS
ncbi:unnamed protein product [Caenorhabditis sp. 36 PRJEB53466]|nr:unnamed protein product [Caenorhabditis sp. 36 PRJEB53466]